jgi:bacteriorhodopsin
MTSTLFLITGLVFLGFSVWNFTKNNSSFVSKISTVIFTVAGASYLFMTYLNLLDNPIPVRTLRYIDWFITVPLMVLQMGYFFSGGFSLKKSLVSLLLAISMLAFGLIGELGFNPDWSIIDEKGQFWDLSQHQYKIVAGMISTGLMINLFTQIAQYLHPSNLKMFLKILTLWCFYPIVYFIPESNLTLLLFSLVDLSAKVGIGLLIEKQLND